MHENTSESQQGQVLFPWRLREMLDECEKQGRSHIVSWLPDGEAFKVHNVSEFVSTILPSYFKMTKYKSFQRQLNLWNFERITQTGADKGAYFHKQFLKSQPNLCRFLKRERANTKKASSARKMIASLQNPLNDMDSASVTCSEADLCDEEVTFTTNLTCSDVITHHHNEGHKMEQTMIVQEIFKIPEDPDNFPRQEILEPIKSFEGNIFFPLEDKFFEIPPFEEHLFKLVE